MNILIVCPFDNGGQGMALCGALNKYSEHEARCLTITQTYLGYDTDILWTEYNTGMKKLELRSLLLDRDFFIFSELIPWGIMGEIGLQRKINNNNTIIRVGGTYCRQRANDYLMLWLREGFMLTGSYHDWSLVGKIGRIALTRNIVPIDKIPKQNPPKDKIRIAFAPTKKEKGADEFTRVMDTLIKEYPDTVEAVPIVSKSWKEAIKIKSECNMTFDQFMIGTYANSAIESMFLSHVVLSRIDLWTQMLFPDLPVINVNTERDLYEQLKWLIENPEEIEKIGKKGKDFVEKYHTPEKVAKMWGMLIEHVKTK